MKPIYFFTCCLLLACSSPKKTASVQVNTSGDTRTAPVEMLNDDAYFISQPAPDADYAYTPTKPVKVGGKMGSGPVNERRYLNGLLGPDGQKLLYFRRGSCCSFKTPNGFDGIGLLDVYRVYWDGATDTLNIYINMYDEGDLLIPNGLTARKKPQMR